MKLSPSRRLAVGLALPLSLLLVSSPVAAGVLDDLGIDLDKVLGRGGSGGGGDVLGLAERILEKELPRRVGPARSYEVKLDRSGSDLSRGRLSRVDVRGIDVRTSDGLVIPDMALQLDDVRLRLSTLSLESVAKSAFSAGLGQEAVSRYVQKRAGANVRDVQVGFRDNQIVVKATPELIGFAMPSEVAGKPELSDDDTVNFRATKLSVLGIRVPQFAISELERKVNPVVDLSGLKLPVRITQLRVQGSKLVASGAADFSRMNGGGSSSPRRERRQQRDQRR